MIGPDNGSKGFGFLHYSLDTLSSAKHIWA